MKQYIIETTSRGGFIFLTAIQAESVDEAINIKNNDHSIGRGTVTGATQGVRIDLEPLWGEALRDVVLDPPEPTIFPHYKLVNRA